MKITLELDDYQAANLRALFDWLNNRGKNLGIPFEEIEKGVHNDPRISWFGNGDWVGEIWSMLPESGYDWKPVHAIWGEGCIDRLNDPRVRT